MSACLASRRIRGEAPPGSPGVTNLKGRNRDARSFTPSPLSVLQDSRCSGPGLCKGDSPCSPEVVAMERAHQTRNPDCPAAALASALAYSAAGLIPSRLSSVWTCPPLPAAAVSSPIPRWGHPASSGCCPLGAPAAGRATWRKKRVPAGGLSLRHARVNEAEGPDRKNAALPAPGAAS